MDRRAARRKGLAILNLESELDKKVGRPVTRNGQKVFGARRIQRQRRMTLVSLLRAETGTPREIDCSLTSAQRKTLKVFWEERIARPDLPRFPMEDGGLV